MDPLSLLVVTAALFASDADIAERRARTPNHIARRIAGEHFPDVCGPSGNRCTIIYDERTNCPGEFIIRLPNSEDGSEMPRHVYVQLDSRGTVTRISSKAGFGNCPDSSI